jgi:hypothetical protein
MTRSRYALYVLARMAESAVVALGAALLAWALQRRGILTPLHWAPPWAGWARHAEAARALSRLEAWTWPAVWAVLAHVLLGPKQTRPIYLRLPGAMYVYAGVKVGRNAGCRGGCVTGATGSGKTLACILPRLHSLCINEAGAERREWSSSAEAAALNSGGPGRIIGGSRATPGPRSRASPPSAAPGRTRSRNSAASAR